jgi:uncharacterized protein (DUF2235 family)
MDMARKLALFLDGTTDTQAGNTNVWRLKSLCHFHAPDGTEQKVYYAPGVGTSFGEKIRGGALGYGVDDVVVDAYEWLVETYEEGDEVFVFGFSRGAYTARSLAGFVSRCGLIQLGAPISVKQLYDRYRKGDSVKTIRQLLSVEDRSSFDNEEQWVVQNCYPIDIKFTGVWDTVGALGNGLHWALLTGGDHQFLDVNLRKSERFVYHALAIDEHRQVYDATLFTVYAPNDQTFVQPREIADVEQRWFAGAHGDVGGGGYNDLLAQVPMQWLLSKAKLHGLTFRREISIQPEAYIAPIYDSFADEDLPDDLLRIAQMGKRYYRPIDRAPEPRSTTVIHTVNETIDKSVFDRWRQDADYRPPNLIAWAEKHGVDPANIQTSVRADTPSVAVPD